MLTISGSGMTIPAFERDLPQNRPQSRGSLQSGRSSSTGNLMSGYGSSKPMTPGSSGRLTPSSLSRFAPSAASIDLSSGPGAKDAGSSNRYSLMEIDDKVGSHFERAKFWTPTVEDNYRLQFCGWRDVNEYREKHGEPDRHPPSEHGNGFISKLQLKSNGYFTYWRKDRQCEDRHLHKVRLFAAGA